ncbi:hypothetical protein GCM10023116_03980 [Kistimonas scapharcae]|uniref:Uncharacterized protein n=1 Tax=Kistimonas scapharcae TaxID=1036133 RepID=A0ABP8UYD0_9GAMM
MINPRKTAYEWHGGQSSELYAFASSGIITNHDLLRGEIFHLRPDHTEGPWTKQNIEYLDSYVAVLAELKTNAPWAEPDSPLEVFIKQYLVTALWSSIDYENEAPMDDKYDLEDIHFDTLLQMRADCVDFYAINREAIDNNLGPEQAGHDFWLTRNGHGAGFWDGDWPKDVSDQLDINSKNYGTYDLYIGDDNLIHGE